MKDRYQIVTYSHDIGADEKQETTTLKAAHQLVYAYLTEGHYDGACIYDHLKKRVAAVYNDFDQERIISAENRNKNAQKWYIARVNPV